MKEISVSGLRHSIPDTSCIHSEPRQLFYRQFGFFLPDVNTQRLAIHDVPALQSLHAGSGSPQTYGGDQRLISSAPKRSFRNTKSGSMLKLTYDPSTHELIQVVMPFESAKSEE